MRFSFPLDAGPFVWLLLVLAFLALVFVVERALFLHRGLVLSSDFIEGVRNNLRAGRPLEMDAIINSVIELGQMTGVPTPSLSVVAACVNLLNRRITDDGVAIRPVKRA
mgnify:CR=1 FL=1